MSVSLPEPWNSFVRDLDQIVNQPADFHCIGGFVVVNFYGFERETRDLDVLEVRFSGDTEELFSCAREGSALHREHRVYLDRVTVIEAPPEDYETRLTEMYPGSFANIRLFAPEAHDLALMKLQRNIERDREDVKHLVRTGHITAERLLNRYESEMRPYVALPEQRTDPIIRFWVDMIREQQEQ